jgi:hypothetical protein
MSENRVLEIMEDILYLRDQQDTGLEEMLEDSKDETVNLYDVAQAFIQVTDDLAHYVDVSQEASQGLQELRLLAIIQALPEEVQTKIKASFEASEDDLLEEK